MDVDNSDAKVSTTKVSVTVGSTGPQAMAVHVIRTFHMEWFALIMGWGGLALVLNGYPPATRAGGSTADAFNGVATVIWLWDAIYAFFFTGLLLARILLYPRSFWRMWHKSDLEPLFFGAFTMGLAVVGMGFIPFCPNIGDQNTCHNTAYGLFWLNVVLCLISMLVPIWMMITAHTYTLEKMPAGMLLPIVSCVVCAAFAGVIGNSMATQERKLIINIAGYVLWGAGMVPAGCVIAVFVCRLFFHGVPPGFSAWILLGPIGQGANGIMMLGRNTGALQCSGYFCASGKSVADTCLCEANMLANHSLINFDAKDVLAYDSPIADQIPLNPLASLGLSAPGITLFIGMVLWGFGIWLFLLNVAFSIANAHKSNEVLQWLGRKTCLPDGDWAKNKRVPFGVAWWGVLFPIVTQTMSTYQLNTDTGFSFFYGMGALFGAIVMALALYIHAKTIVHALSPTFWENYHAD